MLNRLATYLLSIILLSLASFSKAETNTEEQHMKVVLRMVGHEFLLQMGDSTSRVLPIKKDGNRYVVQFEKEIEIEPDLISFVANGVFKRELTADSDLTSITTENLLLKEQLGRTYILEVESCDSNEVVYSYEYNPTKDEGIVPCKSRPLPQGCYQIFFTFLDDAIIENASVQADNPGSNMVYYLLITLLLIIVGTVYFRNKKKTNTQQTDLIAVGNYQFDKNGMRLIYNGRVEELSSKEADLLELLVTNENQTLERDYILNKVWNDEGDYVGRTLDVSISKLRKKLVDDANLKIINIRGVGYRFTISKKKG